MWKLLTYIELKSKKASIEDGWKACFPLHLGLSSLAIFCSRYNLLDIGMIIIIIFLSFV